MKAKPYFAKSVKNPPEKKPLSEAECIFSKDRVPDQELTACLVWEFLRESATAKSLAGEWGERFALGPEAPDQRPLWEKMKGVKPVINYPFNWESFAHAVIVQAFGFNKLFDSPWQTLNKEGRTKFITQFASNPPAFIGYDLHLAVFNGVMREKTAANALVEANTMLTKPFEGKQAVLMIFDWGRYDAAAIKAKAHGIIDGLSAPQGLEPEVRRASGLGRADEWRGKLNELGLTRISARYHASQLRIEAPKIYEIVASTLSDKGTTAVEKKLAGARQRFQTSFRQIMPFEKSLPICLAQSRFANKRAKP